MGALFLIRHGQASYGEADYDRLSTRGEEQARAVGRWVANQKLDAIYAGPLRRQVQTAAIAHEIASELAGSGATLPPPIPLPAMAEYPAFEMLQHLVPRLVTVDPKFEQLTSAPTPRLLDQAFKTVLDKWATDEWHVEGLERVSAFVTRVRSGLDLMMHAARSGARIACVTSAGPIGVAVGLTFGIPDAHMVKTSIVIRNASITELRFRSQPPQQISLVTFNLTAHLPDELQTER